MTAVVNQFGQLIGPPLADWRVPAQPTLISLRGRHCWLEPLDPDAHVRGLSDAFTSDVAAQDWTYLPFGPFASGVAVSVWVEQRAGREDVRYYAIVDPVTGKPTGVASFMRIDPPNGCIEIGGILFSRSLSKTATATEAMFLMLDQVFELGYRRCEWKCDAFNEPSRRAAMRLGFSYEGTFRQATMYKGRSRDTAWYAITDKDWATLRDILSHWLQADNFDQLGRQKVSLSALTRPHLKPLTADGAP